MPSPTSLSDIRTEALSRRDRGDLDSARTLLEQSLEAAVMAAGEDHPEVLVTEHLLATMHRQAGDLGAARRVLENALYNGGYRFGEEHPLLLSMSFDLAQIADELGNRHEARRQYTKVATHGPQAAGFDRQVQVARAWLGPDAPAQAAPAPVTPAPPTTAQPPEDRTSVHTPPARPAAPVADAEPVREDDRTAPHGLTVPPRHDQSATRAMPLVPTPPAVPLPREGSRPAQPEQFPPAPARQDPPRHDTVHPEQPRQHHQEQSRQEQSRQDLPPRQEQVRRDLPPVEQPRGADGRSPAIQVAPPPQTPARHLPQQAQHLPTPTVFAPPAPPAAAPRRSRGPVVAAIAAATVAVLAAVTTLLLVVLSKDDEEPPGPTVEPRPASDVFVTRAPSGDITVSWFDPSDGYAAQVLLGAREGEQIATMGKPQNGETRYTVTGLNPNWDYCFVVMSIYSQVDLLQSEPVCTDHTTSATASPTVAR